MAAPRVQPDNSVGTIESQYNDAFLTGDWRFVREYGIRDGSVEPCVKQKNNNNPVNGKQAYQGAYWLKHGRFPDGCISHRCANDKNTKDTLCCTVSHMLARDQDDNLSRQACHRLIRALAHRLAQTDGPLRGIVTIASCPHKGPNGDEYCFICYGENTKATDSVARYVLPIDLLD